MNNYITELNLPHRSYLPVQIDLFNNPNYDNLDCTTIMLYTLYAERVACSIYNDKNNNGSWTDSEKHGTPYIYFTNKEAANVLRVSERKISTSRKLLENSGLIEQKRVGLKEYRIFVMLPEEPDQNVEIKIKHKNFDLAKVSSTQEDIAPLDSKNCVPDMQNDHTSTLSNNSNTRETEVTRETRTDTQISTDIAKNDSDSDLEQLRLAGLKETYKDSLGTRALLRIDQIANHTYDKAKWLVDTIFKAKNEVSTRLFKTVVSPHYVNAATRLEDNDKMFGGLESMLLKLIEFIYRKGNVRNVKGLIYTYMRGYFANNASQFLVQNYDLSASEIHQINCVLDFENKEKKMSRLQGSSMAV